MKSVGLTVGNQLRAAPRLLFFGVLSPFSWPTYRWHEIICKHVCLPHHYHQDLASLSWVGHPASNRANLQTCLQSTSKSCLVKPSQSTPLLCSKPPITSEEKAQCWGLQDHPFLLPTPTVWLTVHCAPATLACCSSTSSIYGGTLGHHIHLSSLSCFFLCLYHYLMYFNCWLVYCPPPCTRMWAPWRQGFVSFFVHCCIPWCLNQCLAHNK